MHTPGSELVCETSSEPGSIRSSVSTATGMGLSVTSPTHNLDIDKGQGSRGYYILMWIKPVETLLAGNPLW